MIYSSANLAARDVAHPNKKEAALHRLHLEPDGSTVATDGRALMAVSPPESVRAAQFPKRLVGREAEPPPEGVGIPPSAAAEVERILPRTHPALRYAVLTRCDEQAAELTSTDGSSQRSRATPPCRGRFPEWRGALGGAMRAATRGRVCVDRRALVRLLQALEKACPDRGNKNPVYLEFGGLGDAIVARSECYELGQRAIGMVVPLDTNGYWLEPDEWERSIREAGEEPAPPAPPRKQPSGGQRHD